MGRAVELPPSQFLDNRIYTDARIFGAEQERIFSKTWKFACHESELPNLGDYRVVPLGGNRFSWCAGQTA